MRNLTDKQCSHIVENYQNNGAEGIDSVARFRRVLNTARVCLCAMLHALSGCSGPCYQEIRACYFNLSNKILRLNKQITSDVHYKWVVGDKIRQDAQEMLVLLWISYLWFRYLHVFHYVLGKYLDWTSLKIPYQSMFTLIPKCLFQMSPASKWMSAHRKRPADICK